MAKARYAIVRDGVVWSVTEWDVEKAPNWKPPFGEAVPCGDQVAAGDIYDGEFSRPVLSAPVPDTVTMAQCRLALLEAGLLEAVDAAVAASKDQRLKILWEYATDVRRMSPELNALGDGLGLSEADKDNLFRLAKGL